MEDLGEKYSIRVGIIGDKAYQKHEETELTNAELGAIHEFGATINPTEKQKRYFAWRWNVHKSNDVIVIPERSFLRVPLLSKEGKQRMLDKAVLSGKDRELNKALAEVAKSNNSNFMQTLANTVGSEALQIVNDAFNWGGYPTKWQPTSEWSKKNRVYNPANPTLVDTGELKKSISLEIRKSE